MLYKTHNSYMEPQEHVEAQSNQEITDWLSDSPQQGLRSVKQRTFFSDLNQAEERADRHSIKNEKRHLMHTLKITKNKYTDIKAMLASKTLTSSADKSSSDFLAGSFPLNLKPVIQEGDGGRVCLWRRRMQKIQRKPSPQAYSLAINAARQKKSRHRPQPLSPTIL